MSARYALADKVVLVTGGTGGIGAATCRELLARGARVAVLDRDVSAVPFAAGLSTDRAFGVVADVTDREALDRAVDAVVDRFGRLDVAIANAGVLSPGSTLRTMPGAHIDTLLAVNVGGALNTAQAALPHVVHNQGQLVFLSSVFAFMNGMGAIPYAMSKAAVEQLGRGLRVELARHGASATTAYFSLIDTDMIRHGVDADPSVTHLLSTMPKAMLKRLPPHVAATALVDGIAARAPRVMVPGRWKPFAALQGLINPLLDARLATDRATQDALAGLDRPAPTHTTTSAQPAPATVLETT